MSDDAFLRWNVRPGTLVASWTSRSATGLLQVGRAGVPTLTVVGRPDDAAPLVLDVLARHGEVSRVTLPLGTLPRLPGELPGARRLGDGADWDWCWTTEPPPAQPGEEAVRRLTDDDLPEVARLLEAASPRTSARPGDPHVRGWWGLRDGGSLVACAASTELVDGVPHLAGVAVRPRHRGAGLGGAVTAAVTRAVLIAGAKVCTLGMYADNEPARRVYARLGYRCEHRFSSRALVPATAG
ncbi:MAG: GNAT family N-acetyltransferase [Actinomycetes bacterium]